MSSLHILGDVIGVLILLGLLVALAMVRRAVPAPAKPPPRIRGVDDFIDMLGDDIEAGHVPGVWGLDDHDPTASPRAFDLLLDDHQTRLCLTIERLDLARVMPLRPIKPPEPATVREPGGEEPGGAA